ncbi:uncharacterized protein MEPE_05152 [Melanopsichium pennsylvanicum]|uniref:Uncharacterized protein n=1 Tax=Melanopsichium pennsylvanicum TaxID=63383 RepID=A0AAJ5C7D4_9BASI|nr:uncharacterized protein MEPE_05152 [Melanopsichium pennsylvanicum]
MADAAQQTANLAHDLLSEIIPYPVFRILAGFSNLIYSLLGTANNPASWSSTLLPPLITFFLAYFALVTAYRTVRSMLSLAWFGIKWGAIIGGLIAIWAWWTGNMDAINSTGIAPDTGGLFGQLNSLGPLMNSLYANFPDLYAPGSTRSRSNNRQRASSSRRRTRSSMRGNQHSYSFDSKDSDDYLPGDLGSGFGAFADMFGSSSSSASSSFSNNNNYNNNELGAGGVDFASLLRTLVTEGQRQGIDALSALRAAGKVQDELRRFQDNPGAWFEGVGNRFRTWTPELASESAEGGGYNTRSGTTRQRQNAAGRESERSGMGSRANAYQGDSWWSNLASGVNDFLKREQRAA